MHRDHDPKPFGDAEPPELLKSRVIATLTSARALASERTRAPRSAAWVGLTAAALIAGFLIGRVERASASETPRYLLLLYEDDAYRDDRPVAEIIAEYARWADSLRGTGVLHSGEKLADQRTELGAAAGAASLPSPTGFFIVRATDANSAREIAASSPHVRHGGRIVVHPIEDTHSH